MIKQSHSQNSMGKIDLPQFPNRIAKNKDILKYIKNEEHSNHCHMSNFTLTQQTEFHPGGLQSQFPAFFAVTPANPCKPLLSEPGVQND